MALPRPSPNTTCLVTGASSGIGEQLARGLARRGHNLTIVARREGRLSALAEELSRTTGIEVLAIACDLSGADARRRLVEQVRRAGRDVSVLVNDDGLGSEGPFAHLDGEDELRMVRGNTEAVVDLCSVYGTLMAGRGAGAILNVAPVASSAAIPKQATYAATTAFVIRFSHALHAECRGADVTVTSLCPIPRITEFGDASGADIAVAPRKLPRFMTSEPGDVAEAGLRALERGQRHRTLGFSTRPTPWRATSLVDRVCQVRG